MKSQLEVKREDEKERGREGKGKREKEGLTENKMPDGIIIRMRPG